jgi:NAD(P)-dependent dehydrogenase (short-subunit alcohol dehydrogenase family)
LGKHLDRRVAVVTGGGRGIGRAVCLALADQGASVVVNDLGGGPDGTGSSSEPADEVVALIREGGTDAIAVYESVASMAGADRIIASALHAFGRVDIVVHCAGILRDRMVFNMTADEWDLVIQTHLKGMFAICKPAACLMRQQGSGRIIGFTSGSGLFGNPGQANYASAKDGIAGFIRSVARDVAPYGVTANGIAPAAMTRLTAAIKEWAQSPPTQGDGSPRRTSRLPLRLEPADIAPMVVYLCTDYAKGITGQIFYVQGGEISLLNPPYPARVLEKTSRWTIDEVATVLPETLGRDWLNPAPSQSKDEKK